MGFIVRFSIKKLGENIQRKDYYSHFFSNPRRDDHAKSQLNHTGNGL